MKRTIFHLLLILLWLPVFVSSQSIVNTVHNLSASGPGQIKATSESEICVFCHTPHTAKARSPLWNRQDPGLTYTLYSSSTSSTLDAMPGQPDGSSLLCLSCHDGTIAMGNVLSRPREISFTRGVTTLPQGKSNMGRDLSNDHPISFVYSSALSAMDPQLKDPSSLVGPVKLEQGKLQCTSCHDPHKNIHGDFLVASTKNSNLCVQCHDVNYWNVSSHKTSNATWNGSGKTPWPHSGYKTVAANACENCHSPHHAGGRAQLMNYQSEEINCLNCHNGTVADGGKNIQAQLSKTFRHDVMAYTGIHDASEPAIPSMKHVECADCHNPHATNSSTASAPAVKGSLVGVKGINSSGLPVEVAQYEYEICYRCHSNNPVTGPSTPRQVVQANTLLEFASNSISFHPVQTNGKNPNVPGLISPLTANSMIYCSDCHASNGMDAPGGPHGSIYPQILKAQYLKTEGTVESAAAYALCYSCHARTEFTQNSGDNVQKMIHYKHVVEQKTPCNTCHDPHGINSSQGMANRNTHLINFNTNVVSPLNGNMYFQDNGNRSGQCFLKCHNKDHNSLTY
jgi:predicted CXXCH cytochrome family protein